MKFDLRQALRNLDIEVKPFGYLPDGKSSMPEDAREITRGYSCDRWLAVKPGERWPEFVTFHEMAHILLGHSVAYKKFGAETVADIDRLSECDFMRLAIYKDMHHDMFEAECHVTAILAAQLTDIPFDFEKEFAHLTNCYTKGRDIPEEVMKRAYQTAKKIAAAGKVNERRLMA